MKKNVMFAGVVLALCSGLASGLACAAVAGSALQAAPTAAAQYGSSTQFSNAQLSAVASAGSTVDGEFIAKWFSPLAAAGSSVMLEGMGPHGLVRTTFTRAGSSWSKSLCGLAAPGAQVDAKSVAPCDAAEAAPRVGEPADAAKATIVPDPRARR